MCLKTYLSTRNLNECNLCQSPLKISEPDDQERIDNDDFADKEENKLLNRSDYTNSLVDGGP